MLLFYANIFQLPFVLIMAFQVLSHFFGSSPNYCSIACLHGYVEHAGAEVVECACLVGLPKFKVMMYSRLPE